MNEYYKKVRDNALDVLSDYYGEAVGNDAHSVNRAVGWAMKHKNCEEAAMAVGAQIDWHWAHHELAAHSL